MGRGRGKGRKLAVVTSSEDPGSGSEEVLPACRRRGRPHEPLKDDIEEDVPEKTEEGDDVVKLDAPNKKLEGLTVAYGKKRRYSKAKQKSDMVMEENGSGSESKNGDSTRFSGFRHNGSRRKSKPRQAAEAGVECKACGLWTDPSDSALVTEVKHCRRPGGKCRDCTRSIPSHDSLSSGIIWSDRQGDIMQCRGCRSTTESCSDN